MKPINYLENSTILELLDKAPSYQKTKHTLLRLPKEEEIGSTFFTYVKHGEEVRQESVNVIQKDSIVPRNPPVIGQIEDNDIYNEWLISQPVLIKNYGQDVLDKLSNEFVGYKKKSLVKAIELNQDILDILNIKGDTLYILVSWSKEPMIAKIGDFITSEGYSISAYDMKDYELVT